MYYIHYVDYIWKGKYIAIFINISSKRRKIQNLIQIKSIVKKLTIALNTVTAVQICFGRISKIPAMSCFFFKEKSI